jgi:endonuclease G
MYRTSLLVLLLAAAFLFAGCDRIATPASPAVSDPPSNPNAATSTVQSEELPFGNPSNAAADPAQKDNYLLKRSTAAISYNNTRGTANWIQWKTTKEMLGNSLPRPDFEPDNDLPRGFRRITTRDYSGTGYQRGHLVPSADRFGDRSANAETFLMTNIVPQLGSLNEFPWQKFESYVRAQVRRGYDAYQIAGAYGEVQILKGRVTVPTNCWKIVALVKRGRGAASIDASTRIIAIDMPNVKGIENTPWQTYQTTIRAIEEKTGLDLFSWMPRGEQDRIETQIEMSSRAR